MDMVFFIKFLEDISPFYGPLMPLFWTSGDVCPGFQSQNGQGILTWYTSCTDRHCVPDHLQHLQSLHNYINVNVIILSTIIT